MVQPRASWTRAKCGEQNKVWWSGAVVACVRNGRRKTRAKSVTLHLIAQAVGRRAETLRCRSRGAEERHSLFSLISLVFAPVVTLVACPGRGLAARLLVGWSVGQSELCHSARPSRLRAAKGARCAVGEAWRLGSLTPRSGSSNCGSWRASRLAGRSLQVPGAVGCDLRCQALIRV